MALEFKIVPNKYREELRGVGGGRTSAPNPMHLALMRGETIFVDVDDGKKIAGMYESARRRSFKMTARKVFNPDTKEGDEPKVGHLIWWTKVENAEA